MKTVGSDIDLQSFVHYKLPVETVKYILGLLAPH